MQREYELLSFISSNKINMRDHMFEILGEMYSNCNSNPNYLCDYDKSYMQDCGYYCSDFHGDEIIKCFSNKQIRKSLDETHEYINQVFNIYFNYYIQKYCPLNKICLNYLSYMATICKLCKLHIRSQVKLFNKCYYEDTDCYSTNYFNAINYFDTIEMYFFGGYHFFSEIIKYINYLFCALPMQIINVVYDEKSERIKIQDLEYESFYNICFGIAIVDNLFP